MRRTLVIAGLLLASATAAAAQTSIPGSPGRLGGGDGLAGQVMGFGDLPSSSGPADSAVTISSPINTQSLINPFGGNSFHPAGLVLTPTRPAATTLPASTTGTTTTANGGFGSGAPVSTTSTTGAPKRGTTTFAGGIGPRRFGLK